MIGIYTITNIINNYVYVGQSCNIKRRWRQHKSDYCNKKSHQYYSKLYNAMRKYGLDNFQFKIIELCNKTQLSERELYWIHKFNACGAHGYNQTLDTTTVHGHSMKLTDNDVLQIYKLLEQNTITQNDIAKQFDVGVDTISELNHGLSRYHEGYQYPIRRHQKKVKSKSMVFSLTEEQLIQDYIKLRSFAAIGRKYYTSAHPIRRIALNYGYTSRQLFDKYCRVTKQNKLVNQFDLNGNYITTFENTRIASHIMHDSHVKQVCDGKRKTSKGYRYKYQ